MFLSAQSFRLFNAFCMWRGSALNPQCRADANGGTTGMAQAGPSYTSIFELAGLIYI
jgi:hypothetical protein